MSRGPPHDANTLSCQATYAQGPSLVCELNIIYKPAATLAVGVNDPSRTCMHLAQSGWRLMALHSRASKIRKFRHCTLQSTRKRIN